MCTLADGLSFDCNGNGIPDECDIAAGTLFDTDFDGVPDECSGVFNLTQQTYWLDLPHALEAAGHNNVIEIQPGEYPEDLVIDRLITIQSIDPDDPDVAKNTTLSGLIQVPHPGRLEIHGLSLWSIEIQSGGRSEITHCRFVDSMGIRMHNGGGQLFVTDSLFVNSVGGVGIDITTDDPKFLYPKFQFEVSQSQFINNSSYGIRIEQAVSLNFAVFSSVGIRHCLFAENGIAGFYQHDFIDTKEFQLLTGDISNSIFFNNPSAIIIDPNIILFGPLSHNVILGKTSFPDINNPVNIEADPQFVDPLGPDGRGDTTADNDYHLLPFSPCIDSGSNIIFIEDVKSDFDDNPRFVDDLGTPDTGDGDSPIIDIGPYEFQGTSLCTADLTGDGVLNFFDVSAFLSAFGAQNPSADFAADGRFDFFDVSAFLQLFSAGCP